MTPVAVMCVGLPFECFRQKRARRLERQAFLFVEGDPAHRFLQQPSDRHAACVRDLQDGREPRVTVRARQNLA